MKHINSMKQLTQEDLTSLLTANKNRSLVIENCQITEEVRQEVFSKVRFVNCQFFHFICHDSVFENCQFLNCKIIHSEFHFSNFHACFFQDITFFSVKFLNAEIFTSKFANSSSIKMFFENCKIEYVKFICNSFVATKFITSKILGSSVKYTTMDASTIENSNILNSNFSSCNMRGIGIFNSRFENSLMNYINFDDSLNLFASEFYIPIKATSIKGNKTKNFDITNSNINKHLKGFSRAGKIFAEFSKLKIISKSENKPSQQKIVVPKKHFLPHHINGKNIGSLLTFFLQLIVTIITIALFANLYQKTENIFYKSIPNFVEMPMLFNDINVEMHTFAFYLSLFYFVFSGVLLCLNVVCIRNIRNLLLTWLYRGQSFFTILIFFWIWWKNLSFQMGLLSYFNLFVAFYFSAMFVQSFKTGTKS